MNFLNLYFAISIFLISYRHYKNIFNPLGVFCTLWLGIIFLYNLKLSYLLPNLSASTYLAVYLSIISFILGCLLLTRRTYQFAPQRSPAEEDNVKKLFFLYSLFLAMSVIDIFWATPPFLAENKLATYLSPGGTGATFLHMASAMLPVSYALIFMSSRINKFIKMILFIPPFVMLAFWMQRGNILVFLMMLIVIYFGRLPIKKIMMQITVLFIGIAVILHVLGSLRSTSSFQGYSYINNISELKRPLPAPLTWLYIYPTTSLANFGRVMNNKNIEYRYGLDLVRPLFSMLQLDSLIYQLYPKESEVQNISIRDRGDFDVVAGFNVPSYLYFCYKNFSYFGFFLIPFLMGLVSQFLFNRYFDAGPIGIALYSIWVSYLFMTFHDFLLWNSVIIFSFILVMIAQKRLISLANWNSVGK
jgi:oligosaccharide repeat unit polymerase